MSDKVIDMTEPCPECGARMHYQANMRAGKAIKAGFDPEELGMEPDRHYCLSCDVGLEEYLGQRLDWLVKGKPRGPHDETATLRLMLLQAYRVGYEDGRNGR
jgi:hypothetical protein